MLTLKQISFDFVLVCSLLSTAAAQDANSSTQRSSLTITATAADDRVRITAPSSVVQMHVEVYAASGEKLFDQEIRGGNVFDWHLQNGQAQRLASGNYVCVVTAKSISGRLTQKIGTVSVEEKSVSVQPADSPQLSVQQTQAIGPVEENSSWTIPGKDEPQTPTVIAHDGNDGQMIRGRGALTFRIGDFFSGVDKEQMRLTEDGNLGIGTSQPKASLDVAGTIRAERFLVAKPKLAGDSRAQAGDSAQSTDSVDSVQPLIAGTGTQDRIARWADNAGTLGDSSITEIGGNVGIGTTTPGSKLVVSANTATLPPASGVARFADADGVQTAVFADAFGTNPIFNVRRANGTAASPSAVQADQLLGVIGASGYGSSAYMGTRARVAFWASEMWTNSANGTYLTFNTTGNGAATAGGTERLRIDNAGNVGIGTSAPAGNLTVAQGTTGPGVVMTFNGSAVVPGVNTQFTNTFQVGDTITISGQTRTIASIVSDILLNVDVPFTVSGSNLTYTLAGGTRMVVKGNGNVGIGTSNPQRPLEIANGKLRFSSNFGDIEFTEVADLIAHATEANPVSLDPAFRVATGTSLTPVFTVLNEGSVLTPGIISARNGSFYNASGTAVLAASTGNTSSILAQSDGGIAVHADATNAGKGLWATSDFGTAVLAESDFGTAVQVATTGGGVANLVEGFNGVRKFHITNDGVYVAGSDFAEALPASGDRTQYEPGDVLVVSTKAPGKVEKASRAYDPRVAGIYSTRPGMLGADKNGTSRVDKVDVPVAIVGIVPTKASAMNGSIRVGDLLTTSSTLGYAMRCANRVKCVGAIVGKALEPLANGKGVIKVLVMLR